MPVSGVGYLMANDILSDVSYALIQNPVNTTVPAGGVAAGLQTVPVWDPSMYVGAQVVIGLYGDPNLEVVTITAVVVGVSFTAVFANAHAAGIAITGATFPVRQPTDPFFTQTEVMGYLATAVNDFLSSCPLAIVATDSLSVAPTQPLTALPPDCMVPMRVAPFQPPLPGGLPTYQNPLRETSQSNLDAMNYRWGQSPPGQPAAYYRDKTGLQKMGVTPVSSNTVNLEMVYQQRGPQVMGLADGFIVPDPFLVFVKARVLEYCYSKDGEMRSPGLAKYHNGRYMTGLKISSVFLDVISDPNAEMSQ